MQCAMIPIGNPNPSPMMSDQQLASDLVSLKRENAILRASLERLVEKCKFYGLLDEVSAPGGAEVRAQGASDSGTISLSEEDLFQMD